mmetsp:Transcript_52520/g.163027  ORF Transcript_52520/g.163027 Transcript_52520/m.163027 type:complete len:243 (-) Transcript_52520:32-760(-)
MHQRVVVAAHGAEARVRRGSRHRHARHLHGRHGLPRILPRIVPLHRAQHCAVCVRAAKHVDAAGKGDGRAVGACAGQRRHQLPVAHHRVVALNDAGDVLVGALAPDHVDGWREQVRQLGLRLTHAAAEGARGSRERRGALRPAEPCHGHRHLAGLQQCLKGLAALARVLPQNSCEAPPVEPGKEDALAHDPGVLQALEHRRAPLEQSGMLPADRVKLQLLTPQEAVKFVEPGIHGSRPPAGR